ncbi:ESPR-type extended signal peptide-containing protein, partial [Veillonella fallax]
MNKIFKVIWSKSKQCYVVVSELAKNTTGKKKIIVASILAAMVAGQAMQVEAAYGKISPSNGTGSLAISGAGGSPATASTDDAIAVGQDASATGRGGIAVGRKSNSVHNALSLGWIASAKNTGAIAIGSALEEPGVPGEKEVVSEGFYSIAIGGASQSSGSTSIALGVKSSATKESATAIGKSSNASGIGAFAAGLQTNASGAGSIAIGGATSDTASNGATASGAASIAMGYKSKASSQNAVSIGSESKAQELNAIAIGTNTNVTKQNATAVGSGASVTGHNATAVGNETTAKEQYDNAFGYKSTAKGGASTALGYYATSSGNNSVALGSQVNTTGIAATGIGYTVTSSGNRSVALGASITSNGDYATGIGYSVNSNGEGAIAIGAGTDTLGAIPAKQVEATMKNAIAIGRATSATGESATAIGTEATASTSDAIAVGRKSNASGGTSISFGYNTKATSTNSVAIGTDVSATAESAIALGRKTTASDLNATAVGPLANASGNSASAFGMSATASKAESLALGTSAYASLDKSVALGSNSTTATNATSQGSVIIGGKTISWNGAPTVTGTGMQVSVGSAGAERQIKNVAAGEVSANSTDAINGSQLYAVAEGLRTKYVSINSTVANNQNNDGATGSNSMAIGPNASATKADSVAVGINAQVTGSNSVAIGNTALAKQDYNVAMGSEVTADGNNSVAMGRMASSTGMASLAIGTYGYNNSTASGKYSIAIGRDVTSSAEDAIAMGRNSQATANYALALGAEANASQASGVALGYASTADTAAGVAGYNANTGRSDTYTALSGNVLTSTLGAVSVGNSTNTRQITGVAAGKADTDAVNVAQLKSVNLAFTGNSGSGDVNLSKSKLAVEGGTDSFVTTTAANKKLEIKTTQGQLKNTAGTVSVNGNNGLAVAQNVADVINQANADQSIKYKANGTGNNSVKLSDGLNFTDGTTTTATVGANGQVSFDLNTATKQSITDSATAVARTISLGGDTGTTTAKSLTSGNVNFGIKSGSSTYLTTTANGNDVTLTVNEQAIKDAAKDASSFKVKANTNTAEDVKGGDTVAFNDGDNIAITQTGKTFKIATAKNVTFDTATIGTNTTIGSTGVTTNKVNVGTVSIDGTNGINAGGKAITNVGTGRVANSNADDTNVANIGDVKAIATDAVANLSTNLGITDGTTSGTVNLKNQSLKVVGTGVAKATVNGQTITVDVAKGTLTNNTTTGALTGTAGVVDANDMATAVNTAITKAVDTATGTQKLDVSAGGTDSSVNLKTQKLTVAGAGAATASLTGQTITVNVAEGTFTNKSDGTTSATAGVAKAVDVAAAINNTNAVLGNKITEATQSLSTLGDNKFKLTADSTSTTGQALNKSGGLSFKIAGDGDLVSTSATTDTVNVTVKKGTLTNAADGSLNVTNSGVVTADNMKSVVNDAITKAVTSAKDGSAWNLSTNGGTATKVSGGNTVDLINGDNIEITQDGTDGKKITVKTKKDLTVDSVTAANTVKVGSATNLITLDGATGGVSGNTFTAGNASMNTTGFRLTGGPSVTTAGIDAGNKQITNLASGGTTATNAANIGDINAAISSLTTNLGKNTTIAYKANNAGGQTVSLADGFNFTNGTLTTAEVAANGVVKFNVTQGSLSTDGNGNITNTAGVATTDDVKNAVNTAITKAVDNATGTQKLDISAGGTDSSVNLKTQKLTVAGTGAATASLNGQTITVDVAQGTFTNKSDG